MFSQQTEHAYNSIHSHVTLLSVVPISNLLQACLREHLSSVNQGVDLFEQLFFVERSVTESRRADRAKFKSLVRF